MRSSSENVIENIRRLLAQNQFTQNELAKRTGIHRPLINKYLTGKHTPSLETLDIIARALRVTSAQLITPRSRPVRRVGLRLKRR